MRQSPGPWALAAGARSNPSATMTLATRSLAPLRVKQHFEPLRTREFFESIDMSSGLRKSFQLSDRVTTNDATVMLPGGGAVSNFACL